MTTKTRNWLLAIFILAFPFVLFLIFLFSRVAEVPPPPLAPLPNPNGYEDLVKAGNMLGADTNDYDQMDEEQLRKAVLADAAALSLARAGLSNQCRVPVQFSEVFISNQLVELVGFKRLARAFTAEGRVAELDHRPADAAKSYLDAIRLGIESARGGIMIEELVGIAIEAIGTSGLQNVSSQLDAKSCRNAAATLEVLDSQRQSWDEVMQQESAWSHGAHPGWRYDFLRWKERKFVAPAIAATRRKLDAQEQKTRRLMIDLAARAYELEKGKPPASISDLVPEYLKAIPQDPANGTNMIYSPK